MGDPLVQDADRNVPGVNQHTGSQPHPHEFPRAVVAGEIPSNQRIRVACQRHVHDLDREDLYFDEEEWSAYVDLVNQLKITGGHELTGQNIQLLPWQSWVVGSMLCWRRREDSGRRFRAAFVEVSRGAGKTTLMSTMMLHVARFNKSADCIMLANTIQQARQAYRAASDFARNTWGDHKDKENGEDALWETTERELRCRESGGRIRTYAAKNSSLDGLAGLAYLVDESSEQTTDWMAKIFSALPKLRDAFMISITTPGPLSLGRDSPYYLRRQTAVEALKPENWDELDTFSALFGLDDEDDILDEDRWIVAQPSLGHVIPVSSYRRMLREYQAQGKLGDWERFQLCRFSTKNLTWIDSRLWEENQADVPEFPPRHTKVYAAVDFSKSFDISSLAYGWWEGEKFRLRWRHWVIRREKDEIQRDYQRHLEHWETLDHVEVCENSVQYDRIRMALQELKRSCELQMVGYDALGGMQLSVQDWEQELRMEPFPQTIVSMGPSTYMLEDFIRNRKLEMMPCPIANYALSCVQIVENVNGDRRVCKAKSSGIVDPIVSAVMVMGVLKMMNAERPGAYGDSTDLAF